MPEPSPQAVVLDTDVASRSFKALADRRPAFLTEVHHALITLPGSDQVRLGVMQDWKTGPHQLTYRQAERTFGLVVKALKKDQPGGAPLRHPRPDLR